MKGVEGVILALLQSEETQGNISSLFSCLSDNANILKQFWGLGDIKYSALCLLGNSTPCVIVYINDRELKLPHGKLLPRVKLKGVVVVLREDNKCKLQICDDSQANHNGLC